MARAIVGPLRQYGAYAAALSGEGAGAAAELLRYLGRDPHWAPVYAVRGPER